MKRKLNLKINKVNINLKKYHCFIFFLHDLRLILFKFINNSEGINFTTGLSMIKVSPDHGIAYNLIGNKNTKSNSLLNCFRFINKISGNINKID